jgi:outer membrane receptor for monomeric catechols
VAPAVEQFQKARTYGVEPSFSVQIQPWWKMIGSYSLLSFHTDNSGVPAGSTSVTLPLDATDPTSESSLRCSFDLPCDVSIDAGGRFVDKIAGADGYFVADFRVAWQPTKNWGVSVVGQNLFDGDHVENPGEANNAAYIGPQVYGRLNFKF